MVGLTIGMATYKDFEGVYFTLQALRLYHDLEDTELLVVDNFGCDDTQRFVEGWAQGRYIRATEAVGTAAPRDLVFREAHGEAVLCCDSHVLFVPGAIARLKAYYREHPDCPDLIQGPLLYDDLHTLSTHLDPVWREHFWGTWATDPRGEDPEGEPFEIPMQGLGMFSCRKAAWPGFNPHFRGFGGEEGYIHEKFRQAGGAVSLPAGAALGAPLRPAGRRPLSADGRRQVAQLPDRARGARPGPRGGDRALRRLPDEGDDRRTRPRGAVGRDPRPPGGAGGEGRDGGAAAGEAPEGPGAAAP